MMNCYIATAGPNPITVTITGLSSVGINGLEAFYDIYVYGSSQMTSHGSTQTMNGTYSITPTPYTGPSVQTTTPSVGWDLNQWTEGYQYVVFRDVPISGGQQAVLVVSPDPGNSGSPGIINGIQIVPKQ
jgi:hypothetical protein